MVLLLPETKGKTLPETIEDAENMHRYGASSAGPTDQSSFPSWHQSPLVAIHHQKSSWEPDTFWPGQVLSATQRRTGEEEVSRRKCIQANTHPEVTVETT